MSFLSTQFLNDKLLYNIQGNRFLHHMVRYLVGTMLEIGRQNISLDSFMGLIDNKDADGPIFKAPPGGLYLDKVYYE